MYKLSTKGEPEGTLVINDDSTVPANRFGVGIGMSGAGTFAVQAGPNLVHQFKPTPNYWIAAGQNVSVGDTLSIDTITQTSQVHFPTAVYNMQATLGTDNKWSLKQA